MLYLVHRVTISIKLRPVKLEQVVSESLPHKGLYTELLGVQLTCLDPVPARVKKKQVQSVFEFILYSGLSLACELTCYLLIKTESLLQCKTKG